MLYTAIYGAQPDPEKNATPEPARQIITGTGWPAAQGCVVTNYHVVENAGKIRLIRPDGTEIRATLEISDEANDPALLKALSPNKLPPALPISGAVAWLGASVFTVGYPHPGVMGASPKVTSGQINSLTGLANDPRAC